jgi:hypothetical protein
LLFVRLGVTIIGIGMSGITSMIGLCVPLARGIVVTIIIVEIALMLLLERGLLGLLAIPSLTIAPSIIVLISVVVVVIRHPLKKTGMRQE